jgi:hypothetical protein
MREPQCNRISGRCTLLESYLSDISPSECKKGGETVTVLQASARFRCSRARMSMSGASLKSALRHYGNENLERVRNALFIECLE